MDNQFGSEWGAPQQQQQPMQDQFFPTNYGENAAAPPTQQVPYQPQAPVQQPMAFQPSVAAPVAQQQPPPAAGAADGLRISATPTTADGNSAANGQPLHQLRFGFPEDDLPLLEELGINPGHIMAKSLAVLNPFKTMQPEVVEDTDLAGPVVFAIALGCLLSLQGKVEFGAIYTMSLLGTFMASMLLTLMSDQSVGIQFVVSALGYCLLPSLVLASVRVLLMFISSPNSFMVPMALVTIAWSGWCASQMFVTSLSLDHQKYLLLYPALLFYAIFAAITIF